MMHGHHTVSIRQTRWGGGRSPSDETSPSAHLEGLEGCWSGPPLFNQEHQRDARSQSGSPHVGSGEPALHHPHQARCVVTKPRYPGCKPHGPCLQLRGSLPQTTTRSAIYQHPKPHSPHQSSTCCGSAGGSQAIKVTHHGPTKHRGPLGTHSSKDPSQPPSRRTPIHEEICLPIMYILVICCSFFFASFRG